MHDWNPKVEKLIRDLGDYLDTQMKDLLNPRASMTGSALRTAFRAATAGKPLKRRMKEEGLASKDYKKAMQDLVDLAEQNSSNAADKIKRILPVLDRLERESGPELKDVKGGWLKQMKAAKKFFKGKGISY